MIARVIKDSFISTRRIVYNNFKTSPHLDAIGHTKSTFLFIRLKDWYFILKYNGEVLSVAGHRKPIMTMGSTCSKTNLVTTNNSFTEQDG